MKNHNDFDVYFNSLNDPEINELSGFFKSIRRKLKKVAKKVGKVAKKVAPAAAFIPGIGPAIAPMLAAVGQGSVAATAVNLLKNSPVGAKVVGTIGKFVGGKSIEAVNAFKPEMIQAFMSVVTPETQQKINKAITILKTQGKDDNDILSQFMRSDLFKGISSKVTQQVVGKATASELARFNLPQDVINKEVARKSGIIAVAATEKVASETKKPFSLKESLPYISLAIALSKIL